MSNSNPANLLGSTNILLTPSAAGLTASVTGQIPVANGGTGAATLTGVLTGNGTGAFTASPVTNHGVVVAGASNIVSSVAPSTSGNILTSNGTDWVSSAPATSGTVTSVSGTTNRITSTGGNTPVIDISSSYVGQTSLTTLGTVTTGVWNATDIALADGGTNASLTASDGGIFYSTASAGAILSGTATAGQILRSGASTAPSWSTATYPATAGTSGNVLTSDGTNWASTAPAGGSGFSTINIQTFTASDTYTPTASMKYAIVEICGGGGGSGGCLATGVTTYGASAGGGGGEYARGVFSAATISTSQTVTIGAGGTAGAS